MKVFSNVMKVFAALAAVAGLVYVVATYGDKIVDWAKSLCHRYGCCSRSHFCDLRDLADAEEDTPSFVPTAEAPAAAPAADPQAADESDFEE